jgi:hypothetical protein
LRKIRALGSTNAFSCNVDQLEAAPALLVAKICEERVSQREEALVFSLNGLPLESEG